MQNFGKIKNVFNNLIAEGISKKDATSKKLFKKYVKAINESEVLKTQFLVYTNIENRVDGDVNSANLFVSENLKLMAKFKPEEIIAENKKLIDLVPNAKLDENYDLSELHDAITSLIFTKRNPRNLDKVLNEMKSISGFIINNKERVIEEVVELPASILTNMVVDKYNQKYSELDESDRKILKVLIEEDFENKKKFYNDIVAECVSLVETKIANVDEESKGKLLKVKAKLMEDRGQVNETEFVNNFLKLVDLKHNLTNN